MDTHRMKKRAVLKQFGEHSSHLKKKVKVKINGRLSISHSILDRAFIWVPSIGCHGRIGWINSGGSSHYWICRWAWQMTNGFKLNCSMKDNLTCYTTWCWLDSVYELRSSYHVKEFLRGPVNLSTLDSNAVKFSSKKLYFRRMRSCCGWNWWQMAGESKQEKSIEHRKLVSGACARPRHDVGYHSYHLGESLTH